MGKYDKYAPETKSDFKYADIVNKYKNPKPKSMADIVKGIGTKQQEFTQWAITGAVRWIGNVGSFATRNAWKGIDWLVPWTPMRDAMTPIADKFKAWAEKIAWGLEGINTDLNAQSKTSKVGEFVWQAALTAPIGGSGAIAWALQWASYWVTSTWQLKPSDVVLWGVLGKAWQMLSKWKWVAEKLQAWAEKNVMQALWPTKEKFKQTATKIAPEFVKKWLVWSREALQGKAVQAMDELGSQIDDMFASGVIKWKVKTWPIIKSLEQLKTKVGKVDIDPARSKVINGVKDVIKKFWDDLTPQKARALRQAMDKIVYSTKWVIADEALSVKNLARKEAADEIRKQFAAISPDLAKLNKEFNFWSSLDDVLTETAKRTWPQTGWLTSSIAGSGALAWGLATWGWTMWAVWAAVLTKKFVSAMQSPMWKTISAQAKSKLANAIVSWNKNAIITSVNGIQKSIPKIPFAIEIKNKLWLKQ